MREIELEVCFYGGYVYGPQGPDFTPKQQKKARF